MYVLVDDLRNYGDVIIRDPRIAIKVIRRIHKSITTIGLDNDMGHGWEHEGRNLLKQFMADCKNEKYWPKVQIVTSNTVAMIEMYKTLQENGYQLDSNGVDWIKT